MILQANTKTEIGMGVYPFATKIIALRSMSIGLMINPRAYYTIPKTLLIA